MTQSDEARGRKIAFIALALLAVIWGYNWVVMKIALGYAPPFTFAAMRTGGAALFLFALLAVFGKPMRPPVIGRMLLLALFQTTFFVSLATMAVYIGDPGKAAILAFTMPFWVLVFAAPVLGERITRAKAIAGGLGLTGVILILSPWTAHNDFLGLLLALGAGFDWAIAVMIAKKIPVKGTWSLLSLNAWQALVGAVPIAIVALVLPASPIQWTTPFILALAYNVVLGTGLAWFMWLFILSRLPASVSGLSSLIIPVIGILADWAQLGEQPGAWESAGAIALIAGLALIAWNQRRGNL
ncbi:MAG: DMT family transporter [Gammaproteobacteria bacterium]